MLIFLTICIDSEYIFVETKLVSKLLFGSIIKYNMVGTIAKLFEELVGGVNVIEFLENCKL